MKRTHDRTIRGPVLVTWPDGVALSGEATDWGVEAWEWRDLEQGGARVEPLYREEQVEAMLRREGFAEDVVEMVLHRLHVEALGICPECQRGPEMDDCTACGGTGECRQED